MCGGVIYYHQDLEMTTYFPNPKAQLPVKCKNNTIELVSWGRRRDQAGHLPLGGWARLESIKAGQWNKYSPQAVKLPVTQFMEKDIAGASHWFSLQQGQWLQGLLARYEQEMKVYIVTISPEMSDAIHDRWPRVMSS